MAHIQGEVLIRRPAAEVFDFVADERNEPTYNRDMLGSEKVTDGPIGLGTRFRATMRSRRRPLRMDIEYTGFDRPHRIASTTRMAAADFTGTVTFTPTPVGTRLRWSWEARPKGAVRLLAPLFGPIGARQERRTWTALRDHLQAVRQPGTPAETSAGRTSRPFRGAGLTRPPARSRGGVPLWPRALRAPTHDTRLPAYGRPVDPDDIDHAPEGGGAPMTSTTRNPTGPAPVVSSPLPRLGWALGWATAGAA
jgi:uncharacterized protein YndB with AHSA1/START domain